MNVHKDLEQLPLFKNAVITIGTFDGVHIGHQKIIQQLKQEAEQIGGETVIITFHPHPRKIVGTKEIRLINTFDEKIELLAKQGIDHLVIVPFTERFSQQTAEEYIHDFLVRRFCPHTIIIGYDHRFGKDRKGDYHLLEKLSVSGRYVLLEIPVHLLNEISVSSTRIREAIGKGDVSTANELLGYEFFFSGKVIEGNRLGRTIGYPTANLWVEDAEKILPGDGVYAVTISMIEDQESGNLLKNKNSGATGSGNNALNGMMNIGFRPTVDGTRKTIEVNIFDFDEDIYGSSLRIHLRKFLRSEQKFAGIEALKQQLAKDREAASKL